MGVGGFPAGWIMQPRWNSLGHWRWIIARAVWSGQNHLNVPSWHVEAEIGGAFLVLGGLADRNSSEICSFDLVDGKICCSWNLSQNPHDHTSHKNWCDPIVQHWNRKKWRAWRIGLLKASLNTWQRFFFRTLMRDCKPLGHWNLWTAGIMCSRMQETSVAACSSKTLCSLECQNHFNWRFRQPTLCLTMFNQQTTWQ